MPADRLLSGSSVGLSSWMGNFQIIENQLNQRCMEIPHGIFNSIVDKGKDE